MLWRVVEFIVEVGCGIEGGLFVFKMRKELGVRERERRYKIEELMIKERGDN